MKTSMRFWPTRCFLSQRSTGRLPASVGGSLVRELGWPLEFWWAGLTGKLNAYSWKLVAWSVETMDLTFWEALGSPRVPAHFLFQAM